MILSIAVLTASIGLLPLLANDDAKPATPTAKSTVPESGVAPNSNPPKPAPPDDPLDRLGLLDGLPGADDFGNPLVVIADDMRFVETDLGKLITHKPTHDKQTAIVQKLDLLISELDKACQACKGGGSANNPSRPLADSVIVGGPGGIGDLHDPRRAGRKWGELPPRERDRITQSLTEGFPAHYQQVLERYYRRLAEEKPAATSERESNAKSSALAPAKTPGSK